MRPHPWERIEGQSNGWEGSRDWRDHVTRDLASERPGQRQPPWWMSPAGDVICQVTDEITRRRQRRPTLHPRWSRDFYQMNETRFSLPPPPFLPSPLPSPLPRPQHTNRERDKRNSNWIKLIQINLRRIGLTSTLTPSTWNTWTGGRSRGMKRKNSLPPLYLKPTPGSLESSLCCWIQTGSRRIEWDCMGLNRVEAGIKSRLQFRDRSAGSQDRGIAGSQDRGIAGWVDWMGLTRVEVGIKLQFRDRSAGSQDRRIGGRMLYYHLTE